MTDKAPIDIIRVHEAERHLVTGLFDQYRVFYLQPSDPVKADDYLRERLELGESVIFVALAKGHDGQEPVGFTQLYPTWSSVRASRNWILNDLFVSAGHRKQGIGEALIRQAMAFAKGQGANWVQLETATDNLTAQSLYEAMGFARQPPDDNCFFYRIGV
jgi:ribosomal protein S18 acetylase RimI-like enzyme